LLVGVTRAVRVPQRSRAIPWRQRRRTSRLIWRHSDASGGIRAGVAAKLDASAKHGEARNELAEVEASAPSEPSVRVYAHARAGDLIVRPAGS
jgi:hypothetical protein